MSAENKPKSLGTAIDEVINALSGLEKKNQMVIITTVCTHLSLDFPSLAPPASYTGIAQPTGNPPVTPTFTVPPGVQTDIRSLKEAKQPSSAREMACIVAFYLQNIAPPDERKDSIGTDEIEKYFKQAGYPLPSAIAQLLKDAKNAGYFDSAERGNYKLNPVGYNLVAHSLPKSDTQGKPRVRKASKVKGKPANKKSKK